MLSSALRSARRYLLPERVDQQLRQWRFTWRNARFRPYTVDFERYGETWRFFVGDRIGEDWYRSGWDWTEIDYLREQVVLEGDVILECGAHHGELTSFFGKWVGDKGRVVAFDPVPLNCSIIAENVKLNDLKNVQVENKAVGSTHGSTVMTGESNARVAGEGGVGRRVDVVRVDDYYDLRPTLLKIDVEGFEAEVLRGAEHVLATRPRLAIELHPNVLPRFGSSVEEVLALLAPHQYELSVRIKGEPEPRPYDGQPITEEAHLFAR